MKEKIKHCSCTHLFKFGNSDGATSVCIEHAESWAELVLEVALGTTSNNRNKLFEVNCSVLYKCNDSNTTQWHCDVTTFTMRIHTNLLSLSAASKIRSRSCSVGFWPTLINIFRSSSIEISPFLSSSKISNASRKSSHKLMLLRGI